MNEDKRKILFIGLDSASWYVINPMIKEGQLSNIAHLMESGSYGNLKSIPGTSPAIWTSIATGKKLKKHGIMDFLTHEQGMLRSIPFRTYHRKTKAIWNMLSDRKKSVSVFNWLMGWPPEKINGFYVSPYYWDMWCGFSEKLSQTYPKTLEFKLPKIDISEFLKNFNINSKWDEWIGEYNYQLLLYSKTLLCLQKEDVDVFIAYIGLLDDIQHLFWKFMEPWHFKNEFWKLTEENIAKYKSVIKNFYQMVDKRIVSELIKDVKQNTTVVIVSDHGHRPLLDISHFLSIDFNKILKEIGLLKVKDKTNDIDPLKTKVYSFKPNIGSNRTFVLLNISKENHIQFMKFEKEIIDLISNIYLDNGEKVFLNITKKQEGNGWDNVDFDLTIEHTKISKGRKIFINNKEYPLDKFMVESEFLENISGTHSSEDDGIIIVNGKDIKKGEEITNASVLDITPTILYLMNLPIGRDMDGKVLTQAIEPSFLEKHPVQYIESYDKEGEVAPTQPRKPIITPYDEELLKRLKTLGYIQ